MTIDEIPTEEHPFEPFVPENATVLIIGSFPGMEQAENKLNADEWFYSAQGNLFWDIISSVYGISLKTTQSKKELFKNKAIGITDIFLSVRRKERSNRDVFLFDQVYNDKAIKKIIENSKIKSILFTSKYVEKHFRKKFPEIKNSACLPSPSPAANIPISKEADYKSYVEKNPNGNTKSYRVYRYKQLLNV